jgi:hypothetical protein
MRRWHSARQPQAHMLVLLCGWHIHDLTPWMWRAVELAQPPKQHPSQHPIHHGGRAMAIFPSWMLSWTRWLLGAHCIQETHPQ